jgi:hypothetical protein
MKLIDTLTGRAADKPLEKLIRTLPQRDSEYRFGDDIETAHLVMLDLSGHPGAREAALSDWLHRFQPCLFGRLAARSARAPIAATKGLAIDTVWIDEMDFAAGTAHVAARIQQARRAWKDRAISGLSSAFVIMFNSVLLARAVPSEAFASVCQRLAELYLLEFSPVERDVVYTESVPLLAHDGQLRLYKASTQLFYSGAHLMRNHDRRFPGGVAVVVNAPGHYARSLVYRGLASSFDEAVTFVANAALRSIGNGGIYHPCSLSSSWHNDVPENDPEDACTGTIEGPSQRTARPSLGLYSAAYQVDVLVQSGVVTDARPRLVRHETEDVWPSLHLEYISTRDTPSDDPDFGWFNGIPVDPCARYHNPWPPRQATNSPEFNY